jgi:hypothetical protein
MVISLECDRYRVDGICTVISNESDGVLRGKRAG